MRGWMWLALLLLPACSGTNIADRAPDSSATGGTTNAGGSGGSGGTAGSVAGSDAGKAAACLSTAEPCDGSTPCCDGIQCLCGGCGIDPACVPNGSACDNSGCTPCCSGQCENGVCHERLACPISIGDYCASNPCVTTWPADATAFCSIRANAGSVRIGACSGYFVASVPDGVTGDDWLFDAATGALVAVVREGQSYPTCLAGPSSFDAPACTFDTSVSCGDAGAP